MAAVVNTSQPAANPATSGGPANTSASTTAPDDATQTAAAADDQTNYTTFFSQGDQPGQYPQTSSSGNPAGGAS